MFVDKISGILMKTNKSTRTRLEFDVWFPYTREAMNIIREGSLLAVKNFSSDDSVECFSIVRITSVLPSHYALGTDMSGYPGFMLEAAVNASKDWQQETSVEDTTTIQCTAVPTMLEIRRKSPLSPDAAEPEIDHESNIPMTGEKVSLIDPEWTRKIINRDLQKIEEQTIQLGTLANSASVDILMLWDNLIRTHFGIFAYTNAGKSNLLSTLTSKIFEKAENVKIVIFDLMGEYGALLVDVLHDNDDACIVYLSPEAMPESVLRFWKSGSEGDLDTATRDIVKTTILPKALKDRQDDFVPYTRKIVRDGKIKMMMPVQNLIQFVEESLQQARQGKRGQAVDDFVRRVEDANNMQDFTIQNIDTLLGTVNVEITGQSTVNAQNVQNAMRRILDNAKNNLNTTEGIDDKYKINMQTMTGSLNDSNKKTLYIVQDNDDGQVRQMSADLGRRMLETRRSEGMISPLVSFIYDEADQFIAQDEGGRPNMGMSKRAAEQLARRGRKYGLGIGISTQRIVYLDTNILGQPHTYMVSKLPRASDREKIQEAFGLSEETLAESLRFGVGQWMLISHNATGIDGLPIPVQLEDANRRITSFLDRSGGSDAQ